MEDWLGIEFIPRWIQYALGMPTYSLVARKRDSIIKVLEHFWIRTSIFNLSYLFFYNTNTFIYFSFFSYKLWMMLGWNVSIGWVLCSGLLYKHVNLWPCPTTMRGRAINVTIELLMTWTMLGWNVTMWQKFSA